MTLFDDFFKNRRVLVVGHTGFKGSWLTLWLNRLGAEVSGISLPSDSEPSLSSLLNIDTLCEHHLCDIRDSESLRDIIHQIKPEVVFHLAAQSLVRASYRKPLETFSTNVMGSANLLEALRSVNSVKSVLMVTTDKVYHNQEWVYPYRENERLGGHDPYSASKAASELVISSYRDSFLSEQGVALATARAGNVIGGGDWSEDRLIPDAIRAWQNQQPLDIRRPEAIRPWQHVLEPLFGYMQLAKKIYFQPSLAGAYNFGPDAHEATTVRRVINVARQVYGAGEVNYHDIPEGPHEASLLILDTSKSRTLLSVSPRWSLKETIERTLDWYRSAHHGKAALDLCVADIESYEALL